MKTAPILLIAITFGFPLAAEEPDWSEELQLKSRRQQEYRLIFMARPDEKRFQISRIPTAKWPQRENFFLKVGETSADNQFRVDGLGEHAAEDRFGIRSDASRLAITYLPSGETHVLVRKVEKMIPTYFAELESRKNRVQPFFVKEGDAFAVVDPPGFEFRLLKVTEDLAEISVRKKGEEEETTFTVKKRG
ncbi:MAG: hypothetical protein AAGA96_14915 [Verrucomicrobiota bacterium]